jgi:hypothetical protein
VDRAARRRAQDRAGRPLGAARGPLPTCGDEQFVPDALDVAIDGVDVSGEAAELRLTRVVALQPVDDEGGEGEEEKRC